MIVKCVYWLFYYDLLFGKNSIVYTWPFDIGFIKESAFLLYSRENAWTSLCFIIPLILLSLLNLSKFRIPFVFDLVIWFIVVNIHNKIYPTLTGGEYLLNQLLFFNIFISDKFSTENSAKTEIRKCLHNFGVLAIIVQVCLVYFFSALAKLNDHSWLHGHAILITSQVNHYSLPGIVSFANKYGALFIVLNYIVLSYQVLFPIIVWIKKIKKPFIFIGIIMHLYIAFVMGLMSFGLIMILCYLFFWPEKKPQIG